MNGCLDEGRNGELRITNDEFGVQNSKFGFLSTVLAVLLLGVCGTTAQGAAQARSTERGTRGVSFTAGGPASVVNLSELAASHKASGRVLEAPERRRVPRFQRSSQPSASPALSAAAAVSTVSGGEGSFTAASGAASPAPSASFLALPDNAVAFNPDTSGAVGPNHLMVTLGSEVRIQNRAGGVISTVSIDAFWGAIGYSNVYDPRVLYDSAGQRWITSAIANPATNNASLLLAVSQSADPTGNWFRHQVRVDEVDGVYPESPNLGLSRDWIVVSANMLDKTGLFFTRAEIFAFNRTNLYAGGSNRFTRFVFAPSGQNFTEVNVPVPAVNLDVAYPTNFLVANWDGSFGGGGGRLRLFSLSGPVDAPVFNDYASAPGFGLFASGGVAFGNPSWISALPGTANFAPQLGTTNGIFIGDARIQNVVYRNGALWCAQHVFLPTNGVARCAVQWWEVSPGATVLQHGRVDDSSGARFYAYPSIAVNRYDDVLVGYSRFAANQFASANYAFRSFQDTPGRLRGDTVLKAGEARFVVPFDGLNLWGDWSGAVVDPVNDTDLWTVQEYAASPVGGIDRWGTWWGRVSPPVSLSLFVGDAPDPVLAGSNVTYTVRLTNNTPRVATGVRLVSVLPAGASFVSAVSSLGACAHSNGVVSCDLGDVPGELASNVVVSASIVARLNLGGTGTNTVVALSFGQDENPLDNTNRVLTAVTTSADLAVTLGAAPGLVVLSNNATFTVTVTNRGPSSAAGVFLTNVLPAGVAFVSASASLGSCAHAGGRVTCTLGTLNVNAGVSITIVGRADVSGSLTNRANVVSAAIDPDPVSNSALAIFRSSAAPTLQGISSPRTINEDGVLGPIAFTVGDLETPAASLELSAVSSNPALVPTNNIVFTPGATGADRFVTVTPLPNANGSVTITRLVRDADGLVTSNSFVLNVTPVNDLPVISDIANQTTNEDQVPPAIPFTIGDVETAAGSLNVTAASSNPTLIPNANITITGTGSNRFVTVRPATNQSGSATITITVSDGAATSNDMFVVTVNEINDLPTINNLPDRTILEDSTGITAVIAIGDIETPAASLVMSGTSTNQALVPNGSIEFGGSGNGRTATIRPATNQFGTSLITITVTDGAGGSTNDTFILTVNPVNDLPTLTALAPLTINEDSGLTNIPLAGISAGPNELQTISITATSSVPALIPHPVINYTSPDLTGSLSLAPAANSNGAAVITVIVNDGAGSNNIVTRTFNVTVNAVNDAPSLSSITNVTINEDTATGTIPFTVGDVDSPLASVTAFGRSSDTNLVPNANVVVNGTGTNRTVSVTPAPNKSGDAVITLFVTDGAATNTGTFTLTVLPVNDLPSITTITNRIINEDTLVSIGFNVEDIETAPGDLVLSATSTSPALTPGISFGGVGTNRTVDIVPATNQSGSATITITVADAHGGSNSTTFVLSILEVNDPPTLDAIADVVIDEDAPLQTVLLAGISSGAPNEAQPVSLTATSSDVNVVSNLAVVYVSPESAGRLEFTPVANASGTAAITVHVSDGSLTNSRSFNIQVSAVNDPPSIAAIDNRQIDEDSTAVIPLALSDVETPAGLLTVQAASSNPEVLDESGVSIEGAGTSRTLRLAPLPDQSGLTTITVTVSDGTNEVAVNFDLNVLSVNDAPTLAGLADLTIDQDSGPTNMAFTVNDAESLPSSLLVTATSANQTLVADAALAVDGNGTSRTLTITTSAGQSGTALIQVTVKDGAGAGAISTTNAFTLTVLNTQVALLIERFGNIAVVSWPTNSPRWVLQSTTNVAVSASWSNVGTAPSVAGERYSVTNSLGESALFYRLRRQ